jgi:PHD/YefM family antitoxin component YafN of YafNO toxin-antitoxin module
MATETVTQLSSDELDPRVAEFLARVSRRHFFRVRLPDGRSAVVMSGDDFDGLEATAEILSNPERAAEIKRALAEFEE